ncbi:MAG: hypothetical protein E7056_03450 [Lentisphaerae bacterium]|nr:hypothetical protein [Lentisphaerota bacterium]
MVDQLMNGGVSNANVMLTKVGEGMSEASDDPGSCGDKRCGRNKMRSGSQAAAVPEGRLS